MSGPSRADNAVAARDLFRGGGADRKLLVDVTNDLLMVEPLPEEEAPTLAVSVIKNPLTNDATVSSVWLAAPTGVDELIRALAPYSSATVTW